MTPEQRAAFKRQELAEMRAILAAPKDEIQRRCWTLLGSIEGGSLFTAQCWLYNGHPGLCQFRECEDADFEAAK